MELLEHLLGVKEYEGGQQCEGGVSPELLALPQHLLSHVGWAGHSLGGIEYCYNKRWQDGRHEAQQALHGSTSFTGEGFLGYSRIIWKSLLKHKQLSPNPKVLGEDPKMCVFNKFLTLHFENSGPPLSLSY